LERIGLTPTVLLFSLGITLLAALAFSLLPALKYTHPNLITSLKEGGRGAGEGRQRHLSRNGLAVAQVSLALVLLIGSGLMIRSFQALRRVQPGFERPEEVLTFQLFIPSAEVADDRAVARTQEEILEHLSRIPGVASAATATSVPMDGRHNNNSTYVADFPVPEGDAPPSRRHKFVSPGYFETMGNPLLAGRSFTWADVHDMTTVAVVTENFAREYWDDPVEAIGKRIREGRAGEWKAIVGVVGNVHDDGVDRRPTSLVYWPLLVADFWGTEIFEWRSTVYVVRAAPGTPEDLLPQVREAVWSVNPNLPLASVRTLETIHQRSTARTSFALVLLTIAAAVALLLGIVGLYGVVAYSVSTRTREIGIRVAIGARRQDVTGMVIRQGLLLAGIGVACGFVAAVALTRLMEALLFGTEPVDPATYAATSAALIGVALLASYLPARRAASVDPMEALRHE
jgi:predicted permease